ncbi:ornithine carbamoyltransferase [Colwellia sp. 1_MG-2023]|uniref:ornithine carbamoyltransferase n=1 Tax=unclassified Colwellia TaxID=196834 RepID=UPI001C0A296A|nr:MULTISPECIES: ornithine carbamoyltransferase [unclassified Colwellia]MBU2925143.1 ornithine carbamoyltransferase [Colwellia sp. C2M11]MDO6653360.1 ornithine carbamoyltransferase [Colwellia sp. 3_MG-2023]MDO6666144.1 ornithine carbamoyltransferase [Colwellia sp. 2_MG-2023]MDO6690517.1 ornithine carbamoyltransferase [Colwellia sp. 1_MG-2023]
MSNFLADDQLNKKQLLALIELAIHIKNNPADYSQVLAGKSVAMIFEKPSLRTHVSFDMGINKLGGHALYLGQQNGKLGERERVSDYAKNLSCFADAIVARVFSHDSIQGLAEHATVPVINALCDLYHPCQALADFVTLTELFTEGNAADLSKVKLAYVGDGNNVSNSLMIMAAILGVDFTLVTPVGYEAEADMIEKTRVLANESGAKVTITTDITKVGPQDVIYTDTWISMGDEDDSKKAQLLAHFAPYQVNHALMKNCDANIVMHCQPAHLEEEITTALFDSEMSVVFQQAENRMWAQNAVLVNLFTK